MSLPYTSLCDHIDQAVEKEEIIEEYFYAGYTHNEILAVLLMKHKIKISLRTLGRVLKKLGLRRQRGVNELRDAVQLELRGSGCYIGCRALARRLLSKYGIRASRRRVLMLQKEFDPEGVELRKSHCITRRRYVNPGPNHCAHIDGYDKLKPFGFPIHAGVDGYSRRVLWIKVGETNNNPAVVASYFLEYLQEIQGVPSIVRMDAGTENLDVEDIQVSFRCDFDDRHSGEKSVIIGSSHSNQRIERWWSSMRGNGGGYWIDLFKDMVDEGVFSTADAAHIECVRFCFKHLLQAELDQIQMDWNQHRIRSCRLSGFPGGKPDLLYFTPEIFGSRDRKLHIHLQEIFAVQQFNRSLLPENENEDFHAVCRELLRLNDKDIPSDTFQARRLLIWLMRELGL